MSENAVFTPHFFYFNPVMFVLFHAVGRKMGNAENGRRFFPVDRFMGAAYNMPINPMVMTDMIKMGEISKEDK